ncbi:sensor histidine kinase [Spirillospora sp. CA-294931]|uniref:sensor histidine kinase n=1 Tax=Spirillospora sp. CA-294931 TaxID=3240042 RepID=UPI003D8FB7F7
MRVVRLLAHRTTWRRWSYLVVGGALLMPYWFLSMVVVGLIPLPGDLKSLVGVPLIFLLPLPATFLTGLVGPVRLLEGTAAKELLAGPSSALAPAPSHSGETRFRTGVWFSLHLHVGVILSAFSLAVPPMAVVLLLFPFVGFGLGTEAEKSPFYDWKHSDYVWLAPFAGLTLLFVLVALIIIAGMTLSSLGPRLLGPSAAEKLSAAEARALRLAERNRLARELHDSVGHALSVVTLQAGAAGRVLDSDPAFAREALGAIEESARSALEDLDHVLGLLREDPSRASAPQPTLKDLQRLLEQSRIAGVELDAEVDPTLEHVPAAVSREAYRIVQEGLTNALRHAGRVPVRLHVGVLDDRLELEMSNPLGARPAGRDHGGGRGLGGIRERVTVLRGRMEAGADGDRWRMEVSLPLRSGS